MSARREALLALKAAGIRAVMRPAGSASAAKISPPGVQKSSPITPPSASVIRKPSAQTPPGPRPQTRATEPQPASKHDTGCGSPELRAIRDDLGDCTRCALHAGRTTIVFGVGNPQAELMFVGEGPGADEDLQGEPFVGRAGQLLTKIIGAMGQSRETVYIANIVKCRPPDNRKPQQDEMETCKPFLFRQIAAIRPKVIVALGATGVEGLFAEKDCRITKMRGQWREIEGVAVMPTFHPSYILRQGGDTLRSEAGRQLWEDMKAVMERLKA